MGVPTGSSGELQFIGAASIVIFSLGIKDDIMVLSASKNLQDN
jgi:hypothetical protein